MQEEQTVSGACLLVSRLESNSQLTTVHLVAKNASAENKRRQYRSHISVHGNQHGDMNSLAFYTLDKSWRMQRADDAGCEFKP